MKAQNKIKVSIEISPEEYRFLKDYALGYGVSVEKILLASVRTAMDICGTQDRRPELSGTVQ